MRGPPRRLRLVPPLRESGPGLVRARGVLDAQLGQMLLELGRLADEAQEDRELFMQFGTAAHAIGLAQRHLRTKA